MTFKKQNIKIRLILNIMKGGKMTRYAQEILDIVNCSHEHLTAEEIYLNLKNGDSKVVLATVYNNLAKLTKEKLIKKISFDEGKDRYDKIIRHDHLICSKCGKISDVTYQDLTEQLKNTLGVDVLSYDLKINYICEECKKESD